MVSHDLGNKGIRISYTLLDIGRSSGSLDGLCSNADDALFVLVLAEHKVLNPRPRVRDPKDLDISPIARLSRFQNLVHDRRVLVLWIPIAYAQRLDATVTQ